MNLHSKIKLIIYVDTIYSEQEKQNIIKEFHLTPLGGIKEYPKPSRGLNYIIRGEV